MLITKTQIAALISMNMFFVVADDNGVVHHAFSGDVAADRNAKYLTTLMQEAFVVVDVREIEPSSLMELA